MCIRDSITTLHTVLREPNLDQRVVMHKIAARSERLIVMSQHSSRILQEVFRVPAEKIDLIPHGIPDLPFEQPDLYKSRFSCQGKSVLLTFGLLSPNKGFESVIQAMPSILARHSNAVYMIAGATHPHVRAVEGDRYRLCLLYTSTLVIGEKQLYGVFQQLRIHWLSQRWRNPLNSCRVHGFFLSTPGFGRLSRGRHEYYPGKRYRESGQLDVYKRQLIHLYSSGLCSAPCKRLHRTDRPSSSQCSRAARSSPDNLATLAIYTVASGGSATAPAGICSGKSRRATPIRLSAIP